MNTIDRPIGWTTIDEAKRLMAANVDLNSADMSFVEGPSGWTLSATPSLAVQKNLFSFRQGYELPCWSLGALLQLLPKQILIHGNNYFMVVVGNDEFQWSICYANAEHSDYPFYSFKGETLVEVCIETFAALKVAEKEGVVIFLCPEENEKGGKKCSQS